MVSFILSSFYFSYLPSLYPILYLLSHLRSLCCISIILFFPSPPFRFHSLINISLSLSRFIPHSEFYSLPLFISLSLTLIPRLALSPSPSSYPSLCLTLARSLSMCSLSVFSFPPSLFSFLRHSFFFCKKSVRHLQKGGWLVSAPLIPISLGSSALRCTWEPALFLSRSCYWLLAQM